jgi:hypothetical protein
MSYNAVAGTTLGLQGPSTIIRRMINQTGAATVVGQLVMCDETQVIATTTDIGTTTSTQTIVDAPDATLHHYARFGVCMAAALDTAEVDVMFRGRMRANTVGAVAEGDALIPAATGNLAAAASTSGGAKIVAVAKETTAGAGLADVAFDGLSGFGIDVAS